MTFTSIHVLEACMKKKFKKISKECVLVKLWKVAAFISDQKGS